MEKPSQFKWGAVLSYLAVALNMLAGLVCTPWMTETLGSSQYGLYTLANALISLFLMDFGLGSAASRYLSAYRARGQQEKIDRFLGALSKLYLCLDGLLLTVLLLLFLCLDQIYVSLTLEELRQFRIVYLLMAGYSVIAFPFSSLNGILTAYEEFVPLKLAEILHRVLLTAALMGLLSAGGGVYGLATVHGAVGLAVIGYKLVVIRKTTPVKVKFSGVDPSLYREIFDFSVWTALVSLSQRMIFNITPTILGIVSSASSVAVFGVVATLESNLYLLTNALSGMFLPGVSQIYAERKENEKLVSLMLAVGKFQYGITGLVIAGFWLLGEEFLLLWVGECYRDAYLGLLLVLVSGAFYNALQIGVVAMEVTKQVKSLAWVNLVMGLGNLALCLLLAPQYGVLGACAAICGAYLVRAILLLALFQKKLGVNAGRFIRECYVRMSVPGVVTIMFGSWFQGNLPSGSWLWLMIKAAGVTAVYGTAVLLFGTGGSRICEQR